MANDWKEWVKQANATLGGTWQGMSEQGNLDLTKRPSVPNPEGGISSVYSMSVNFDGNEYLIPRVSEDGRLMSEDEAINEFKKTGNHLGAFDSPQNATAYAEALHQQQAAAAPTPPPLPAPTPGPAPVPYQDQGPQQPPAAPVDTSAGFLSAFSQALQTPEFNALDPEGQWRYTNMLMDEDENLIGLNEEQRVRYLRMLEKDAKEQEWRETTHEGRRAAQLNRESVPGIEGTLPRLADDSALFGWLYDKVGNFTSAAAGSLGYFKTGVGKAAEAAGKGAEFLAERERRYSPDGESFLADQADKLSKDLELLAENWVSGGKEISEQAKKTPNLPGTQIGDILKTRNPVGIGLRALDASMNIFLDSAATFLPATALGAIAGGVPLMAGLQEEQADQMGVDIDPFISLISGTAQMYLERVAGPEKYLLEAAGATSLRAIRNQTKRAATRILADMAVEVPTEMVQEWINIQVPKWTEDKAGLWLNMSEDERKQVLMSGAGAALGFGPVIALRAKLRGSAEAKAVERAEKITGLIKSAPLTRALNVKEYSEADRREMRLERRPEWVEDKDLDTYVQGGLAPQTDEQKADLARIDAEIEEKINPTPDIVELEGDRRAAFNDYKSALYVAADEAAAKGDTKNADKLRRFAETLRPVQPKQQWLLDLQEYARAEFKKAIIFMDSDFENPPIQGAVQGGFNNTIFMSHRGLSPGAAIAATFAHEMQHSTNKSVLDARERIAALVAELYPKEWAEVRKTVEEEKLGDLEEESVSYFLGTPDHAHLIFRALANYSEEARLLEAPRGVKKALDYLHQFLVKMAEKMPWVEKLTGLKADDDSRQRRRKAALFAKTVADTWKEAAAKSQDVPELQTKPGEKPYPHYVPEGFESGTFMDLQVGDRFIVKDGDPESTVTDVEVLEDGSRIMKTSRGERYQLSPDKAYPPIYIGRGEQAKFGPRGDGIEIRTDERGGRYAVHISYRGTPMVDRSYDTEEGRQKFIDHAKTKSKDELLKWFPPRKPEPAAKPTTESEQEFTSKDTSMNIDPMLHKKVDFEPGTINVDLGGGKFEGGTEILRGKGVENLVHDVFNRSERHNKKIERRLKENPADSGTLSNVLNVIKEPEIRQQVLAQLRDMVKPGGKIYISTYEGDESGEGRQTTKGWQENRKTKTYLEEVKTVFPDATLKGKIIAATASRVGAAEFEDADLAARVQAQLGGRFKSRLFEVVDKNPQKKWTAESLRKFLSKQDVKKEELTETGVLNWLERREGQETSREEVLDYIMTNMVKLDEVVYTRPGGFSYVGNEWEQAISEAEGRNDWELAEQLNAAWEMQENRGIAGEPKWGSYQLLGKKSDYTELIITLPEMVFEEWLVLDINGNRMAGFDDRAVAELYLKSRGEDASRVERVSAPMFTEPVHWGDLGNPMVHVRFNTRYVGGRKILFIEEIQSDWHQAGAKHGYRSRKPSLKEMRDTPGAVADAPFKDKAWLELAVKRMLAWGVENEFDGIAWTTGAQQIARYPGLEVEYDSATVHDDGRGKFLVRLMRGQRIVKSDHMTERKARKVIGDKAFDMARDGGEGARVGVGKRRKIGGEGMLVNYDEILPAVVEKVTKKYGVELKTIDIDVGTNEYVVRETDGGYFAMYRVGDSSHASLFTDRDQAEQAAKDTKAADKKPSTQQYIEFTDKLTDTVAAGPQTLFAIPLDGETADWSVTKDWTEKDWKKFGKTYGVKNMGGMSPLVKVGKVMVPGGTDGEWTFQELMWLQEQAIDPAAAWTKDEHVKIIKKLHRSLTPKEYDPLQALNNFAFSHMSPGLNLNLNELTYARIKMRNEDDVRKFAALIPWDVMKDQEPSYDVMSEEDIADFKKWYHDKRMELPKSERPAPLEKVEGWRLRDQIRMYYNDKLNKSFGIQSKGKGGIGAVGKGQLTNVAEMAQLYLVDPDFLVKGEDESWHVFTMRIASQFRGLSYKTAIFGGVWQDPLHATVAAIDRHMAEIFQDVIIGVVGRPWLEKKMVSLFNQKNKKGENPRHVDNIDELMMLSDGPGYFVDALLAAVSEQKTRKGAFKDFPDLKFIKKPEALVLMGDAYAAALAENTRIAKELGLEVFGAQHMLWDRQRHRFETHATQFPGAYKLPRISEERMREIFGNLKKYGRIETLRGEDEEGERRLRAARPAPSGSIAFSEQAGVSPIIIDHAFATPGMNIGPNQAPMYTIAPDTWWDVIVRKIQDSFLRVGKLQSAITDAFGTPIDESVDVYLHEMLYHGKVADRVKRFNDEFVRPLMDFLEKEKLDVDEFGEWLYARHAGERNEQYRKLYKDNALKAIDDEEKKINDDIVMLTAHNMPIKRQQKRLRQLKNKRDTVMNADLPTSGMTDAEAQAILAKHGTKFDKAAKLFDKMMNQKLEIMFESGLITEELRDKLRDVYKYYVPLKGKDLEGDLDELIDHEHGGQGMGFDIRGDEVGHSFGRKAGERAPHPVVAQSVADVHLAIIRAEKNEVGKAFLRLVEQFPNDDLYEVNKNVRRRVLDRETGTVKFVSDAMAKKAANVLAVKVDGEVFYITIKDTRLASAMKNLGTGTHGGIIRMFGAANRIMARLNTTLNPEFMIANMARDLQAALVNMSDTDIAGLELEVIKNLVPAMRGIAQGEFNTKGTGAWRDAYNEYKREGGQIGFFGFNDVGAVAKDIERQLRRAGPGAHRMTMRQIMKVGRLVESSNAVVENGIRLAAFKTARDHGLSAMKAAALARNLTVNFNKKGEWGSTINALWLFSNASIQGTARMLTAFGTNKRVRAIVAGQFMAAFLMAALNEASGGDDDEDGMSYWEKLPDWVKENNMVFMLPGGDHVKIPLPYGYNVFWVAGTQAWKLFKQGAEGQVDAKSVAASALNLTDAMVGAFSPFGSARITTKWGVFRQAVPTIASPIADTLVNESYYGAPIQPTRSSWDKSPDSARYFKGVSDTSRVLAEWANKVTGGNAYQPGAIDFNPEVLDYLVGAYSGAGAGTLKRMFVNPVTYALSDEDVKIEANDVAFLRRIYGEENDHTVASIFYENAEEIEQAKEAWENLSKDPNFNGRSWKKRHGWKMQVFDDLSKIQTAIKKEPDVDKKNSLRKKFNKAYRQAWESQFD